MALLSTAPRLTVQLARTPQEIEAALRLRHAVFVAERGNQSTDDGNVETDAYDAHCEHLIVIDQASDSVVGTYRLLPGDRAQQGIGFYSESEFDLSAFAAIKGEMLELGRSCVAPEYRNGSVINLLWQGISQYVVEHGVKYLIGCASMHGLDLDLVREVYSHVANRYPSTIGAAVPKESFRIPFLHQSVTVRPDKELLRLLPPLMKGYIRVGAAYAGEPAYDPVFDTVDFFMIIDTSKIVSRYQERYALA